MDIKITMKDGTTREFLHEGRPGGSYTKRLDVHDGVATIEDEWGVKTHIPLESIEDIREVPGR